MQRAGERALGLGIDRARRLVEHQESRRTHLGAGQRHELPLADREALAALADLGVEAVGKRREPPVESERDERALDVVVGRGRRDRGARSRGSSCRRGSRPGARAGCVGGARRARPCAGRRRRARPRPRSDRRAGTGASRTSSCPSRSHRRPRRSRPRAAPRRCRAARGRPRGTRTRHPTLGPAAVPREARPARPGPARRRRRARRAPRSPCASPRSRSGSGRGSR